VTLVTQPDLTFNTVLQRIRGVLGGLDQAFSESFVQAQDVALTWQAADAEGTNLRIHTGPYRRMEAKKHFQAHVPDVSNALILDIDTSQQKLEVPGLRLRPLVSRHVAHAEALATKLAAALGAETENTQ